MPSGVNKVTLIGNLGADPDMRYTPSGAGVCELRLATNRSWYNKQTQQREDETEWHRVVVWGNSAEACAKHLTKGRQVYVEGRIKTRSWDDKEGNKRYSTEIIANDVQFLGGRGDGQSSGRDREGYQSGAQRDAQGYAGGGYGDQRSTYGNNSQDYGAPGGGGPGDDIPF